jgi:HlyD family secretion protein
MRALGILCTASLLLAACTPRETAKAVAAAPAETWSPAAVAALGRLEPEGGVLRIAAPSTPEAVSGAIVTELLVAQGDDVEAGQLLAVTDTAAVLRATLAEAQAAEEVASRAALVAASRAQAACVRADVAGREADRRDALRHQEVVSSEESDSARGDAEARAAECVAARDESGLAAAEVDLARVRRQRLAVELERSQIRAPFAGRVLEIVAERGELVGPEGLLDLGRVDRMYAVAEVFETDIGRVRVGQRATVISAALPGPLTGRVEAIRPRVRKQDVVGTDPAARKDARIVEVEILLDDPAPAAALTHLQVDVLIDTGA